VKAHATFPHRYDLTNLFVHTLNWVIDIAIYYLDTDRLDIVVADQSVYQTLFNPHDSTTDGIGKDVATPIADLVFDPVSCDVTDAAWAATPCCEGMDGHPAYNNKATTATAKLLVDLSSPS
jgi:hypothetical protein